MYTTASELDSLIKEHLPALKAISREKMEFKASPGKWSKKEILGHLIDSAQNNIRRFIVAQYEETPFIVYNQDKWVAICNYQHYDQDSLIELWYFLNSHICQVLKNTRLEMAERTCQTQKTHTLEWLAKDYIKHMVHHLHQVLDLEAVAYP